MKLLSYVADLLFPPRCVFCNHLLSKEETDVCADCRLHSPHTEKTTRRAGVPCCYSPYYYEDMITASIRRFKFHDRYFYDTTYGQLLAMELLRHEVCFDLLTWVPVSAKRRRQRGYDQSELLAKAVGRELGIEPKRLLVKIRDNPPQTGQTEVAARRANVLGAYRVIGDSETIRNKRVLLIDDVITTGATLSECVRVLSTAGAADVVCATLAATRLKE